MDFYGTRLERRLSRAFNAFEPAFLHADSSVVLNPGSGGQAIATDTTTGTGDHMQVVKPAWGPYGTQNIADTATPLPVQIVPYASDGASLFYSNDLDESEEEAKGSAGTLYSIFFYNANASARYLKAYANTASGTTVGSTAPYFEIPMAGSTSGWLAFPQGVVFATGITFAATTGLGTADTGAPSPNDVIMWATYK